MRLFDPNNLNQEILFFIREWITALSNNFQEAIELLDISKDKDKHIIWNTEVSKELFLEYGNGVMLTINNVYEMDLQKEKIYFYEYNDKSGIAVEYDLPLDGVWGDLTAQFSFIKISNHLYYIYLNDIHVL